MLTLLDEFSRECLAIRVARRLGRYEVIETLAEVMKESGVSEHIRSDNGPEFVAKELRQGLAQVACLTLYIEPGSPRGERLLRKLQRTVAGRMLERRDLLFT